MDALMRNGENRMGKKPRNSAWMCELYIYIGCTAIWCAAI